MCATAMLLHTINDPGVPLPPVKFKSSGEKSEPAVDNDLSGLVDDGADALFVFPSSLLDFLFCARSWIPPVIEIESFY